MTELAKGLLGVRLDGPPPIRDVFIELQRGLTVLYGLNGAGKTRVLESVASALSGDGSHFSQGSLIVRGQDLPDDVQQAIVASLDAHRGRERAEQAVGDDPAEPPPWYAASSSALVRSIGDAVEFELLHHGDMAEFDDADDFVDEIARQQWLLLDPPRGLGGEWNLSIGAARDERSRCVSSYLDATVSAWDECVTLALGTDWPNLHDFEMNSNNPNLDLDWMMFTPFANESTHLWGMVGDQVLTEAATEIDRMRHPRLPAPVLCDVTVAYSHVGYVLSEWAPRVLVEPFDIEQPTVKHLRAHLSATTQNDAEPVVTDEGWTIATYVPPAPMLIADDDGVVRPSEPMRSGAAALALKASELFARCLVDAPRLELRIADPGAWLDGPGVSWVAVDPSGADVPLDALSQAQRRWATFAIGYVLATSTGPPADGGPAVVVFLDEPDAALHATAQRNVVAALKDIGRNGGAAFASTHSREFLNDVEARLVHVKRDPSGWTAAGELDGGLRERVSELGLAPADLLQLARTVVAVEGRHDQVILQEVLGDELERAGALVLALRGAQRLPGVLDGQLLLDYTDAHIVAALDNLQSDHVARVWADARSLAAAGNLEAATDALDAGFSKKTSAELGWLKEFCWGALERDLGDRISIHAMQEKDIIFYLPVEVIVPGETSWVNLARRAGDQSFKPWLKKTYGVEITHTLLVEAVGHLDEIPADFVQLLDICRLLQRRTPMRPDAG